MKCLFRIADSEFHSFSFDPIDSRMYLLIANNKALTIDPCVDEAVLQLLKDKNVTDVLVLPTHEHYDHISGINWLKAHFSCNVVASEQCAKNMMNPKRNLSAHIEALFIFASDEVKAKISAQMVQPYLCTADEVFNRYKCFIWQNHKVEIKETPGHSKGSVCIIIDNEYIFTGDSLIKGVPTITRLPGGSRNEFTKNTLPFLKTLPQSSTILPGHGEAGHMHELFSFPWS